MALWTPIIEAPMGALSAKINEFSSFFPKESHRKCVFYQRKSNSCKTLEKKKKKKRYKWSWESIFRHDQSRWESTEHHAKYYQHAFSRYINECVRCLYPKHLQSILLVNVLPGNRTHYLSVFSALHYPLSYKIPIFLSAKILTRGWIKFRSMIV